MDSLERPSVIGAYVENRRHDSRFLFDISDVLAMSLPTRVLAERVAAAATQGFCDICAVFLTDETGALKQTLFATSSDVLRSKAETPLCAAASDDGFIRETMRSGQQFYFQRGAPVEHFSSESAARLLHASGARSVIAAPLLIGSSAAGVLCFLEKQRPQPYDEFDVRYARVAARQFSMALENARLRERERRVEARASLLREATDRLFSTADERQMLAEVLDVIVQQFADRAAVLVLAEDELQVVASSGPFAPFESEEVQRLAQAIRERQAFAAHAPYADAWMLSPLFFGDGAAGALACYSSARRYDGDDLKTLRELCQRTSLALEYASSFARERRLAQTLQRAALPPSLAPVAGAITSVLYRPAAQEEQVGGDWYDVFALDSDRVLVSIGDVTGHGLPAWSIMAKLRHSVNVVAKFESDPVRILDATELIVQQRYPDAIATAFLAIMDTRRNTITYANAGHPAPMLRRSDGAIEQICASGLPIGLRALDDQKAEAVTRPFAGTDLLVFYTDGLTEATRNVIDGERWLIRALQSDAVLVTSDSAEFIKSMCLRGPLPDDVAVLALNYKQMNRWRFSPDDQNSSQRARHEFCERLRERGANNDDCATAEIIFGELVSNVVKHAAGPLEAALEWRDDERAALHVLDRGPGYHAAALTRAELFSESGRGLWLIKSLGGELEFEPLPGFGMHTRILLPPIHPGVRVDG